MSMQRLARTQTPAYPKLPPGKPSPKSMPQVLYREIRFCSSGGTWREQVNLSSSGASGNPITISAYGVGPDPIISGADLVSGPAWTTIAPNVWGTTVAAQPKVAFFNGQRGTRVGSLSALASQYDWFWSNNTLYIYSSTNPSVVYTAPGVEVGSRPACVFVTGSFVTVRGLHATKSNTFAGIFVWTNAGATEGITIEGCRSSDNYQAGIRVANARAGLEKLDSGISDGAALQ
jgi:hypothetical protein